MADLHQQALVVDLHNDLLTKVSHLPYDLARRHAPAAYWNPLRLDIDLPKAQAGGLDVLGCAMFSGFRVARQRRFWRQLDAVDRLLAAHGGRVALVDTAAGVRAARAAGKTALFLGVEGSYALEGDVEAGVARLAERGARYLGLLWERDSGAGGSCRSRDDRGLTDLGRALVAACARRGISIDVAHAGRRTFWEVAEAAPGPILCSHAGAAAVHAHPRNLDDDQIRAIARGGGVVGVIFVAPYLGGSFASLHRVADHVEHVARVGGEGCVALGSDFDGFMPLVRGMRDAADLPRLTQILWDRGWRGPGLRRLLGENALAFFERAWTAR